ncbi:MAG: glycosyltransferase, partial [Erysipelotrichaceae bacterium]|nr:glycosyltransferase [Erysipelotrichaceae bacterium]
MLHHDLSNDDKNNLINSFKSQTFRFIEIDENEFKDFPISSRYPLEIYYRLFAPLLLPNSLDRILYLDVDIVVINSL